MGLHPKVRSFSFEEARAAIKAEMEKKEEIENQASKESAQVCTLSCS